VNLNLVVLWVSCQYCTRLSGRSENIVCPEYVQLGYREESCQFILTNARNSECHMAQNVNVVAFGEKCRGIFALPYPVSLKI
jgi:hypothetical protein